MGLRFVTPKSDMYQFIDATWNVFKGECEYSCSYCYCKKWGEQKPLRFDEKEFSEFFKDITKHRKQLNIFVGSSCDMFAPSVNGEQIQEILDYLKMFNCEYLFQTKNPARLDEFIFPEKSIFCITVESDIYYPKISKAPKQFDRIYEVWASQRRKRLKDKKIMITVEPILRFTEKFVGFLEDLNPIQINIGANTSNIKLPEPTREELTQFIDECEKFTKVVQKKNLARLLK